jgi:predicted cupin superfamily sugar epimerase
VSHLEKELLFTFTQYSSPKLFRFAVPKIKIVIYIETIYRLKHPTNVPLDLQGHCGMVVPKGVFQGARLIAGGAFALIGATVAPGFEFSDYEEGIRDSLIAGYPRYADLIAAPTPR